MSLLSKGVDWLKAQRETHLSETVTYDRTGLQVSLPATRGSTDYDVVDESGLIIQARSTDFIISADDLVLNNIVVFPEVGDKIFVTEGLSTLIFVVLKLGAGGHYRPSDSFAKMLRIHTKHEDTL